jgi:hypothetical protein
VRPELFEAQLAAGTAGVEQKETAATGEALWKVGIEFDGNFADAALRLDDLRDRDELAYSRISSAK